MTQNDSNTVKNLVAYDYKLPSEANGQVPFFVESKATLIGDQGWQRDEQTFAYWGNPYGWKLVWIALKAAIRKRRVWPVRQEITASAYVKRDSRILAKAEVTTS